MPSRVALALLVLAPAAVAGAQAAPGPAAEPALSARRFALQAGWGYYEVSHLGVAYHVDPRASVALFGGYGTGGSADTVTVGASFSHALFGPVATLQPGWDLKAIYWTRSDPNYDWKVASFVLGAYLAKDLTDRVRLALDGGVALSVALESTRKQDFNFGHPQRWTGSVGVEASYRLGGS